MRFVNISKLTSLLVGLSESSEALIIAA